MMNIHELPDWPNLYWDNDILAPILASIRHQQGFLLGRMSALGFDLKNKASLEMLTADIIKSSQIEGEKLDFDQVRSSVARRLGIDIGGLASTSRHVDGVVEMMLDATQKYQEPLTQERLFDWHSALFPAGRSGMYSIVVGAWRTPEVGPMQIVSGPIGHERVHFEAPDAGRLSQEMKVFLDWFNDDDKMDPILKAGVAHFWFVTIHPFEDGNGRIGRAIADMCLARADGMSDRFYSMSSSIAKLRKDYYSILEISSKNGLDITHWLEWFCACLGNAIETAEKTLERILHQAKIWEMLSRYPINARQRKIIDCLFQDFEGKLTTSKYAKINKCSQDTAHRDIQQLIGYGVLVQEEGGGRSTSYRLL